VVGGCDHAFDLANPWREIEKILSPAAGIVTAIWK